MTAEPAADGIIWEPYGDYLEASNVRRFMDAHGIATYDELIERSTSDVEWFWDAALTDLGLLWDQPYSKVLDESRGFPWARWFVDGRLNIVRNCVDRHAAGAHAGRAALEWVSEDGERRTVSYAELDRDVCRAANALKAAGLRRGDAVGIYMPMVPELVVALYAALKLGVTVIPVFSGFGDEALATRLGAGSARLLFTADGSGRRGKPIALKHEADRAAELYRGLEKIVVVDRLGAERGAETGVELRMTPGRDVWWDEFLAGQPDTCATESLGAEERSLIIFTSGTTGKPKGTVHTHVGCLSQMAEELGYAFDVKPEDVFFWLTDIGWVMGSWELIGVHFFGATVVLYEGAPDWPHAGRLWEVAAELRVTHLGVSPTALRLFMREGPDEADHHDLSSLRYLGSTGEPLDRGSYLWLFERVGGGRIPIINISGGTEIAGCFLLPLPISALKPSTVGGPAPGMAVECVDDDGVPVREQLGYLVCRRPSPSMTKSFLNDPERYLSTYFERFGSGVWFHGDWAYVDADGFWYVRGRADDTIKVSGRRTGPAEIEAALIEHPAVSDAAAVGVPDDITGEGVVCFVVLHAGSEESEELRSALVDHLVDALGHVMRPEGMRFVDALPKTRSGKIVRGVIKRAYLGQDPGDLSSLEDPSTVSGIRESR